METLLFVLQSLLLGVGLAMDAFTVSLADGLAESRMRISRMCAVAGIFAFFQALMPMIGWLTVHTAVNRFGDLARFVPWIAFLLLIFLGSKMLIDALRGKEEKEVMQHAGFFLLLAQGVATSIDALSVGFTIASYDFIHALWAVLLIAAVTFLICFSGIFLGKKFGMRLAGKAGVFGGVILILIGCEILITHLIG